MTLVVFDNEMELLARNILAADRKARKQGFGAHGVALSPETSGHLVRDHRERYYFSVPADDEARIYNLAVVSHKLIPDGHFVLIVRKQPIVLVRGKYAHFGSIEELYGQVGRTVFVNSGPAEPMQVTLDETTPDIDPVVLAMLDEKKAEETERALLDQSRWPWMA